MKNKIKIIVPILTLIALILIIVLAIRPTIKADELILKNVNEIPNKYRDENKHSIKTIGVSGELQLTFTNDIVTYVDFTTNNTKNYDIIKKYFVDKYGDAIIDHDDRAVWMLDKFSISLYKSEEHGTGFFIGS